MYARLLSLAFAAFLCPLTLAGQSATQDTFNLFTGCSGVFISVQVQDREGEIPELTTLSVSRAVRSRLRVARIFDPDAIPYLDIHVMIVGNAFSVSTQLRQPLTGFGGIRGVAATWTSSTTGTSGRAAGYVQDVVTRHLDQFIDEYLRVNEDACA